MNRSHPPRLVMLRPLGLGDFLTGVPAYRALARAFPDHRRILAAPGVLAPLARACGAVHAVVDTPPLTPLREPLRHADVAVDLHGKGPASHRILLEAAPRQLIAFACADIAPSSAGPPWCDDAHEVSRWCRMLRWYGIETNAADLGLDRSAFPPSPFPGAIVLHPGAASASRRWPLRRWIAVAKALRRDDLDVVLTGNAREFRRCRSIAQAADIPLAHVLAGKTDLAALCGVVGSARALVSGDTGVAHVATALRIPSVVLFGPMPPQLWGPPADPRHRALWREGRGDPHGRRVDERLAAITVREVLDALPAVIAGGDVPTAARTPA